MKRKKRDWIEIETLKDGTPNIATSFRKLKEINQKKREEAKDGTKPRHVYACVFCGRVYTTAYRLMGHIGHCDKRKQFRKTTREGLSFTIGEKIFEIKTTKLKVLKTAEEYEKQLKDKINSGEMTTGEAERLFYVFLKGAQSAISVGSVQYTMRDIRAHARDIEESGTHAHALHGENEEEEEKEETPLPPSTPIPSIEKEEEEAKEG
jgi:hypothetical protein